MAAATAPGPGGGGGGKGGEEDPRGATRRGLGRLPPPPTGQGQGPQGRGRRAHDPRGSWAVSLMTPAFPNAFVAALSAEFMAFGRNGVDLTRVTLLGEPRGAAAPAGLPPHVMAELVSAAGRAFVDSTRATLRLVVRVAMVPLYAAFNCLVSVLLPLGLPLTIVSVFTILSFLAIVVVSIVVSGMSDEPEAESGWDDVDEQEADIGR